MPFNKTGNLNRHEALCEISNVIEYMYAYISMICIRGGQTGSLVNIQMAEKVVQRTSNHVFTLRSVCPPPSVFSIKEINGEFVSIKIYGNKCSRFLEFMCAAISIYHHNRFCNSLTFWYAYVILSICVQYNFLFKSEN